MGAKFLVSTCVDETDGGGIINPSGNELPSMLARGVFCVLQLALQFKASSDSMSGCDKRRLLADFVSLDFHFILRMKSMPRVTTLLFLRCNLLRLPLTTELKL